MLLRCIPAHSNTNIAITPARSILWSRRSLHNSRWALWDAADHSVLGLLIIGNPSVAEVFQVRIILIARGFPAEIAVKILRFMNYEAKRRIAIPNDPFHPSNKEELIKYLDYCWKPLIHSGVMANALGKPFNWREVVSSVLLKSRGRRTAVIGAGLGVQIMVVASRSPVIVEMRCWSERKQRGNCYD